MKKIFKKSLAIMVSAAICLTALIGCLSVSAATRGEGTFTVGSDSGKPGELVTVPIELAYTSSNGEDGMGIAASLFDVSYNTNALTITGVAPGEDAIYTPNLGDVPGGENVPPQYIYTVEYRPTDGAVRILAMPAKNETVLTSMTVNLTFTINEGAAAQDYAITITEQQTCDYGQATPDGFGSFTYADNEEFIAMSITEGAVTVVEDAPVCTHENLEFVSAVPATADAAGSITFKCKDCNEDVVKTVNYYQYYATTYLAPQYESEVLLTFSARESFLSRQGAYSDGYVVLSKENVGAEATNYVYSFDEADTTVIDDAKSWSVGLPAKMFNDEITSTVFVEYNGEWYSGLQITQSLMGYASTIFDTVSETEKRLIADLANYGAAAQIHFNYDANNLATSKLTSEQLAYATDGVAEYVNDLDNPFNIETDKIITTLVSLSAESKLTINYQFATDYYTGQISDLTAKVTFTNAHGELKEFTYTNADFYEVRTNRLGLDFDGLAAYDLRKPVTISFYENGVKVSCDTVYSAQSMAYNANTSGYAQTEINLYNEMLQYCDSANAHFIK